MKQFSKELGKVSITPKGDWDSSIANERLDIVYDRRNNQAYIAKQDVPIGVDIDNREYWQPLNVSGYADNNFINLTAENENGTITAYESLEEAVATIFPINRRVGATLSFYNLNSDRLDRQAEFELWQFNSTDLANWENKDYWNNIYYNWNVFAGWYIDADALKNHVEIPNVGQYAYVGSNLNDALLYQCRTNGTWTNTGIKVRNYISVVVSGNITIGENGNWFSNGEDTGIPATPAVDEQIDNIIMQLQQHTTEINNLKESDANLQDQITSNDSDITNLTAKHESLSRTVQGIAVTGGASTATNVTYNNDSSGLNAENAQDAIDELQGSKIDKTSILQESGEAEDKVMSQKATSTELTKKADKTAVEAEAERAQSAEQAIIYDVSALKKNYVFAGIATPGTNPGTPDVPVFYIATEAGTYSNFGGISVADGEAVILQWNNGSWAKKATGFATAAKLVEIDREYNFSKNGEKYDTLTFEMLELIPSDIRKNIIRIVFDGNDGLKHYFSYKIPYDDYQWSYPNYWVDETKEFQKIASERLRVNRGNVLYDIYYGSTGIGSWLNFNGSNSSFIEEDSAIKVTCDGAKMYQGIKTTDIFNIGDECIISFEAKNISGNENLYVSFTEPDGPLIKLTSEFKKYYVLINAKANNPISFLVENHTASEFEIRNIYFAFKGSYLYTVIATQEAVINLKNNMDYIQNHFNKRLTKEYSLKGSDTEFNGFIARGGDSFGNTGKIIFGDQFNHKCSEPVQVYEGDIITFNITVGYSAIPCALYNSMNANESDFVKIISNGETIQQDGYIRYCYSVTSSGDEYFKVKGGCLPRFSKRIDNIEQDIAKNKTDNLVNYDYLGFIGYGQSLGAGWAHGVLTTKAKYACNELMFGTSHQLVDRIDEDYTKQLRPLVETQSNNSNTGETSDSKALETVIDLFLGNGYALSSIPKFICSNASQGGASINGLKKGTTTYNRIIKEVQKSKEYCDGIGKSYAVCAITYTQGESNNEGDYDAMSKDSYKAALKQLISDFNKDIKLITEQKADIKLIIYQTPALKIEGGNYAIQDAQLEASLEDDNIIFGAGISDSKFQDAYHIDAVSTCKMGCRYGATLFGVLNTGNYDNIRPYLTESSEDGTEIYITFNTPYPPLKLEEVPDLTNYGFSILKDGVEKITSIELFSNCQIKITCSEDVKGATISYARNSKKNEGSTSGFIGIGGLRDSMGEKVSFISSETYKVDNVAPTFSMLI